MTTALVQAELVAAAQAVERLYGVRLLVLRPDPWEVVYGEATLDAWVAAEGEAYGDDEGEPDPVGEGWDEAYADDDAEAEDP